MATDEYTTAGSYTWTCPTGCTSVQIECWGGGGAGGRTGGSSAAGGGGGAYAKKNTYSVTAGNGYSVVVGAGAVDATSPSPGGDSYFVNTSTCMAKGGGSVSLGGTSGAAGGSSSSSVGDTKYSGGTGGSGGCTGVYGLGGGGGGSAGTGAGGNTGGACGSGGQGASAVTGGGAGGDGGPYGYSGGMYAENGFAPGGGGGGAGPVEWSGANYGGHGAAGKVLLTYTTATIPTVTTTTASSITSNSASSGGNVTSDGGATVTDRGLCWNKTGTPTISDTHTHDGSGTGSYASSMTSLNMDKTYYYRAWATNSQGTGYGNTLSFSTLKIEAPLLSVTAEMPSPTVLTTVLVLVELSDAASSTTQAALPGPEVEVGLVPPQLILTAPDIYTIRVDWY